MAYGYEPQLCPHGEYYLYVWRYSLAVYYHSALRYVVVPLLEDHLAMLLAGRVRGQGGYGQDLVCRNLLRVHRGPLTYVAFGHSLFRIYCNRQVLYTYRVHVIYALLYYLCVFLHMGLELVYP